MKLSFNQQKHLPAPPKKKIKNHHQQKKGQKSQQNKQKQPTKLKTPLQNTEVVQIVQ